MNDAIRPGKAFIIFAPFTRRHRWVAWIPTIVGGVLLLNVFRVVVMSSPFPFAWPLERPLQLIMHFPYALIVPLFVAPALVVHLVVLRRLMVREQPA